MRNGAREGECEKVKLTQTLSITCHLTRIDDNVDIADNAKIQQRDNGVGLAVCTSVEVGVVGGGPQFCQRCKERSCLFKGSD